MGDWLQDKCNEIQKAQQEHIQKSLGTDIEKARSGVYKPTKQNLKEGKAGQKYGMSQSMKEELDYDKKVVGEAMAEAFKTPEGYEMKNKVKKGDTVTTSDADSVEVKGFTKDGNINVKLTYGKESIKKKKKHGIPVEKDHFNITWSKKQFDTIVG